jgi:hypothetical protein
MNCCGKKRTEWQETRQAPTPSYVEQETAIAPPKETKPRIFQYTGERSFKLKGAMTGKIYYFRFKGHTLEVDYNDAFSMMAERDVAVVKV